MGHVGQWRRYRRVISFLIAGAIVLSMMHGFIAWSKAVDVPPTSQFTDIKGHWAEDAMKLAIQNGLIKGRNETHAAPEGAITRAELAAIMVRAFGGGKESSLTSFVDVGSDAWYYSELSRAVSLGFIQGSGQKMRANDVVTREEAAVIVARAFGFVDGSKGDYAMFADNSNVSSWAETAVGGLVNRGVLNGNNGNLYPKAGVTRAEYATMMANLVTVYCNNGIVPAEKIINGNVLVSSSGITLSGKTINGDVYVTEGTGTSGLTLDGCDVNGTVYVRTPGGSPLKLTNNTTVTAVNLSGVQSSTGVQSDKTSKIGTVILSRGAGTNTVAAQVGTINVLTSSTPLLLKDAKVEVLNINAGAQVDVDASSEVDELNVTSSAGGAKVTVLGKVADMSSAANRVVLTLGGKIGSVAVSGDDVEIETIASANIANMVLKCTDGAAKLNGTLSGLDFSAAKNLKVTFDSGLTLDEYVIDSNSQMFEGYKNVKIKTIIVRAKTSDFRFAGSADKVIIEDSAKGAKITFTGGTTKLVVCKAENARIIVNSGATVNSIDVTGKGVSISGSGKVTQVTASGNADNLSVSTNGTKVTNDGCSNVRANGQVVADGKSVTTSGTAQGDGDKNTDIKDDANSGKPTYRLTFHANNSSGETQTFSYIFGREIKLPDPDEYFTRKGYNGTGWALSSKGDQRYAAGETYKMPAYTTSLYAVWEKDSGNGDGGKDEGGAGEGGDNKGETDVNAFTVKFPSDAYPADLSANSSLSIDMFAENIVLSKVDNNNYSVAGTVKYLSSITTPIGVMGSGYFIPLVVSTSGDNYQIEIEDCSDQGHITYVPDFKVKSGIKYNGKMIVFVQVDGEGRVVDDGSIAMEANGEGGEAPKPRKMNFTVSVDQDITDTVYEQFKITYDFTNLVFKSNPETSARISATKGAPLIEAGAQSGANSVIIEKITPKGYNDYSMKLKASNVTEQTWSGAQGHWVGVRIQAPEGADRLVYSVDNDTKGVTVSLKDFVDVDGKKYVEIYRDVVDSDGTKNIYDKIRFVWKDANGNNMTPNESIYLDYANIAISGAVGESAITGFLAETAEGSEWIAAENGGKGFEDYVSSASINQSEESAWVYETTADLKPVGGKYYLPVDFTVNAATGSTILMKSASFGDVTLREVGNGVHTGHALMQIDESKLEKGSDPFQIVYTLSCDGKDSQKIMLNATCTKSSRFLSVVRIEDLGAFTFKGKAAADLCGSLNLSSRYVTGEFKKVTGWSSWGVGGNGYFLPVRFKVTENAPEHWVLRVNDTAYTEADVSGGYLDIVVKLGDYVEGAESPDVTSSLMFMVSEGMAVDAEFIDMISMMVAGTFEGYKS